MAEEASRKPTRRQVLKVTAVAGISLAFGGSIAAGLFRLAGMRRVRSTRTQMGTRVTVTVMHPDAEVGRSLVDSAFAEMDRLEGILSRHRPGSALDRLNRDGTLSNSPPELLHLLTESAKYWEMTGGAFDPTIAPLLRLYEARASNFGGEPETAQIESARALVDYRKVHLNGGDIRFGQPGMAVTLDGIAKGYIVDCASEVLLSGGADRAMVEAGGDVASVRGGGNRDGWTLALQDPRDPERALGVIRLTDEGVATSGDYMQAFTEDLTLHHILDPSTGRSPEHTSGVTVIAPNAMQADALSTAVFILGPTEGLALLEPHEGLEGLLVTKDGETLVTDGFARHLG